MSDGSSAKSSQQTSHDIETSNKQLIDALDEIRAAAKDSGNDIREKAYTKAIFGLKQLTTKITPENVTDVTNIPGIGPNIRAKIIEFITTGTIQSLAELRNSPVVQAHRVLGKIIGVGPSTIRKWINTGVMSIEELRTAMVSGKIKLNKAQSWGLKFYDDLNTRIPREEVTHIGNIIYELAKKINNQIIFDIAGSYRRGKQDSGDIDILVTSKTHSQTILPQLIESLRHDPQFVVELSSGDERITFLYRSTMSALVRQIDVLYRPHENYYAALLYFTGSWEFNVAMRGFAKDNGFRLNQNGLYKTNNVIPVSSEKDIFDHLNIKYIPPHLREGTTMIEPK